jgi:putative transposase
MAFKSVWMVKRRWVDNVMVERLWRSVKYEEVYLKAYSSVTDAKKQLSAYFEFYNLKRPHSSLDMRYRLGSQSGFEIIRPINNLFDRQSDVLKRHNTDV